MSFREVELRENRRALRQRRVVFWFAAMTIGCLCVYFGLFIGWKVYGG